MQCRGGLKLGNFPIQFGEYLLHRQYFFGQLHAQRKTLNRLLPLCGLCKFQIPNALTMKIPTLFCAALITLCLFKNCRPEKENSNSLAAYLDLGETGIKTGGIKMIPVHGGKYKGWTK